MKMKKLTFALILMAAFCFAACGNNPKSAKEAVAEETIHSCCEEEAKTKSCCDDDDSCGDACEGNCEHHNQK